jgi:hypothetical protein
MKHSDQYIVQDEGRDRNPVAQTKTSSDEYLAQKEYRALTLVCVEHVQPLQR